MSAPRRARNGDPQEAKAGRHGEAVRGNPGEGGDAARTGMEAASGTRSSS